MAGTGTRLSALRRVTGILVILGLLVAAVAFYRMPATPSRSSAAEPAAGATSAEPTPPVDSPTSATPSAPPVTPTVASSSATRTPTPDGRTRTRSGLPDGPGTTSPGILLVARLGADGDFDVSELVRLSDPLSVVTLAPPQLRRAGERFVNADPVASAVEVSAGDEAVSVPERQVKRRTAVAFAAPAKRFTVSYTLSGVTVRNVEAPRGRALAALQPLVGGVPAQLPVQVVVIGRAVLNLVCPNLPLSEQTCAAGAIPRMWVNRLLPWRSALVVIQLDLERR